LELRKNFHHLTQFLCECLEDARKGEIETKERKISPHPSIYELEKLESNLKIDSMMGLLFLDVPGLELSAKKFGNGIKYFDDGKSRTIVEMADEGRELGLYEVFSELHGTRTHTRIRSVSTSEISQLDFFDLNIGMRRISVYLSLNEKHRSLLTMRNIRFLEPVVDVDLKQGFRSFEESSLAYLGGDIERGDFQSEEAAKCFHQAVMKTCIGSRYLTRLGAYLKTNYPDVEFGVDPTPSKSLIEKSVSAKQARMLMNIFRAHFYEQYGWGRPPKVPDRNTEHYLRELPTDLKFIAEIIEAAQKNNNDIVRKRIEDVDAKLGNFNVYNMLKQFSQVVSKRPILSATYCLPVEQRTQIIKQEIRKLLEGRGYEKALWLFQALTLDPELNAIFKKTQRECRRELKNPHDEVHALTDTYSVVRLNTLLPMSRIKTLPSLVANYDGKFTEEDSCLVTVAACMGHDTGRGAKTDHPTRSKEIMEPILGKLLPHCYNDRQSIRVLSEKILDCIVKHQAHVNAETAEEGETMICDGLDNDEGRVIRIVNGKNVIDVSTQKRLLDDSDPSFHFSCKSTRKIIMSKGRQAPVRTTFYIADDGAMRIIKEFLRKLEASRLGNYMEVYVWKDHNQTVERIWPENPRRKVDEIRE